MQSQVSNEQPKAEPISQEESASLANSHNKASNTRLLSLDTLRGFDMFWIIGGGTIIASLHRFTQWQWMIPIEWAILAWFYKKRIFIRI